MNFQSLFKEYTPVEYGDFFRLIQSLQTVLTLLTSVTVSMKFRMK